MLINKCTACEMNIRPNARFCHACGVPVWPLRICESCNSPTPVRGCYCDQCGAVLETPEHVSDVVPVSSIEQVESSHEGELEDFSSDFDPDFDFDDDDVGAGQFINPAAIIARPDKQLPAKSVKFYGNTKTYSH